MTANFFPVDAADYLDDDETVAEYLTAALQDPNHSPKRLRRTNGT